MADAKSRPHARLQALEAIRGIAALVVVLHHLAHAFWPGFLESRSPFVSAFDGSFAVTIFFVLSGVVLSMAFFEAPARDVLAAAAIRRYFRLTPPILVSVLLACLLLYLGAFANKETANALGQSADHWLRRSYAVAPNFSDAFREGTYRTYLDFNRAHSYNTVLWTMNVEFFGSMFVFAFLALAGSLRRRALVYMIVGAALFFGWRYTLNFLVGIALCDYYVQSRRVPFPIAMGQVAGAILLVTGLFVGSALPGWFGRWVGVDFAAHRMDCQTLGAVAAIGAVLFCPFWQRRLEFPWLTWLGRISFSLYLLHQLVICSVGCRTFLWLHAAGAWSQFTSSLAAAAAVVVVSLLAAWAMTKTVDWSAIALGKKISALFCVAQSRVGEETPAKSLLPKVESWRVAVDTIAGNRNINREAMPEALGQNAPQT